jgi:cobalt-zinc-cadmium efflux system outer membrane protein
MQPPGVYAPAPELVTTGPQVDLTIECLVQLGLANSPAVAQAAARVNALRGRWVQVGLPPNPTVGYLGAELGNDAVVDKTGDLQAKSFLQAESCNSIEPLWPGEFSARSSN